MDNQLWIEDYMDEAEVKDECLNFCCDVLEETGKTLSELGLVGNGLVNVEGSVSDRHYGYVALALETLGKLDCHELEKVKLSWMLG